MDEGTEREGGEVLAVTCSATCTRRPVRLVFFSGEEETAGRGILLLGRLQ
jgi:hypothetical protein